MRDSRINELKIHTSLVFPFFKREYILMIISILFELWMTESWTQWHAKSESAQYIQRPEIY